MPLRRIMEPSTASSLSPPTHSRAAGVDSLHRSGQSTIMRVATAGLALVGASTPIGGAATTARVMPNMLRPHTRPLSCDMVLGDDEPLAWKTRATELKDAAELKDLANLKDLRDMPPGLLQAMEADGLVSPRSATGGIVSPRSATTKAQSRRVQVESRKLGRRRESRGQEAMREATQRWDENTEPADELIPPPQPRAAGRRPAETRKLGRRGRGHSGSDALREAAARWERAEAEGGAAEDAAANNDEGDDARRGVEAMLAQKGRAEALGALPEELVDATTRALEAAERAEAEAAAAAAKAAEMRALAVRARGDLDEAVEAEMMREQMAAWAARQREEEAEDEDLRAAMQRAMERGGGEE